MIKRGVGLLQIFYMLQTEPNPEATSPTLGICTVLNSYYLIRPTQVHRSVFKFYAILQVHCCFEYQTSRQRVGLITQGSSISHGADLRTLA